MDVMKNFVKRLINDMCDDVIREPVEGSYSGRLNPEKMALCEGFRQVSEIDNGDKIVSVHFSADAVSEMSDETDIGDGVVKLVFAMARDEILSGLPSIIDASICEVEYAGSVFVKLNWMVDGTITFDARMKCRPSVILD